MASAQVKSGSLIDAITAWFSKDVEENPLAKVTFSGTKITDSVYDLRPAEKQVEDFNVEIVFFHGLQPDATKQENAYFMTWMSETEPPSCWPVTLLPKLFPKARLLTVKLDGLGGSNSRGVRYDPNKVMENLVVDLFRNNRPFGAGVGQTRAPVVLVTHCFGGVVAQKLLLEVDRQLSARPDDLKLRNLWNNLGGIVYFSPPLDELEDIGRSCFMKPRGSASKLMDMLDKEKSRVTGEFTELVNSERLLPTPPSLILTYQDRVIDKISPWAEKIITVKGDHLSICQPVDETSESFQCLASFVQMVVKDSPYAVPRSRGNGSNVPGSPLQSNPLVKWMSWQGHSGDDVEPLRNAVSVDEETLMKASARYGSKGGAERLEAEDIIDKYTLPRGFKDSTELTFFKRYD